MRNKQITENISKYQAMNSSRCQQKSTTFQKLKIFRKKKKKTPTCLKWRKKNREKKKFTKTLSTLEFK